MWPTEVFRDVNEYTLNAYGIEESEPSENQYVSFTVISNEKNYLLVCRIIPTFTNVLISTAPLFLPVMFCWYFKKG